MYMVHMHHVHGAYMDMVRRTMLIVHVHQCAWRMCTMYLVHMRDPPRPISSVSLYSEYERSCVNGKTCAILHLDSSL